MKRCISIPFRSYATHVNTPLLLPVHPPDAPRPPPPAPSKPTVPPAAAQKASSSAQSSLPKPRLDYNHLLADTNLTTANHLARKAPLPLGRDHVPHLQRLRDTQLLLIQKLSSIKAKQNEISTSIKNGFIDRVTGVEQAKKLKAKAADYESTLSATEAELLELGLLLPNFTSDHSPLGSEENAVEVERFGPEPRAADKRRDHLDVANHWDLVDNEASVLAVGSSWPYLKGTLALLEQALISYALAIAVRNGFTPVSPPDVVRADIAWRCGFQPRDQDNPGLSQTYNLHTPDGAPELCLAGTAEVPLAGLFANKTLRHDSLPQRVVGVGKAYRAEAGARGIDTRGLYRVHQFQKVELFAVTGTEGSEEEFERMTRVQKEIIEGLGLSVRVLEMPTEELGASASRKWDMEAWMPGRGRWGEITSTSNCTDFQARRLHIRYRSTSSAEERKASTGLEFAHTLNGTAAAIPRLLVALIENGVLLSDEGKPDGLELPRALERYWVGTDTVGEGKNKGTISWV